jgi:glutathione S-transferase
VKLFFNPASPYVRKVLVVAMESGLTDRIEIAPVLLTPVKPDDTLNAENPLGKIPALLTDDGTVLYDSRVICEYVDGLGDRQLFPAAGPARWTALRRQALADGICDAAILVRYEGFIRPAEHQWDNWIAAQKSKFMRAVAALETEAATLGDTVDIGTLSVAIALAYLDFRNADDNWRAAAPELARWHEQFYQRESLQQTQPEEMKS